MISESGKRMLSYLPPLYETSRVMQGVLDAQGVEIDKLRQALTEVLDQFFVRTATWGLDRWEEELGLSPAANQPISERRDRIVSRIRGYGTVTVALVKEVAESYDKGTVDVIPDPATYTVTIRFVDTMGVPPNIDDLKAAVRAVLPAHLDVKYEFRYFLWSDLDALNITWDDWDALGLTWNEVEVYH